MGNPDCAPLLDEPEDEPDEAATSNKLAKKFILIHSHKRETALLFVFIYDILKAVFFQAFLSLILNFSVFSVKFRNKIVKIIAYYRVS